jgi:hypothetical protein
LIGTPEAVENPPAAQETEEEVAAPLDSVSEPAEDPNSGVQRRINKLTAEKHEARRQAGAYRAELEALRNARPTAPAKAPRLEDFDYDEQAFTEARIAYQLDQKLTEFEARNDRARREEAQREQRDRLVQGYEEKLAEFRRTAPDFAEVVGGVAAVLPPALEEAILASDEGPALAYYLGNHLDVAERLAGMSPYQAAMQLGKIEASLPNVSVKQASKAPEPIKKAGNGGGAKPVDLTTMPIEEYAKLRASQLEG